MASVAPPVPSNEAAADLRLPGRLIEGGNLSEAQLETILMANDAHARDLPGRFTIDDDQTRQTALEKEGVHVSLANLLSYPFVKSAVDGGRLSLHGLWTDISDMELHLFDGKIEEFIRA